MSMTNMILYLYVCCAQTFGLCGSKNATSSCRGEWSVLSRKAQEAGKKTKANVGAAMVVGRKTTSGHY